MKETDRTQELHERINAVLDQPEMSQAKLSRMIGISPSRFSQWRHGTYPGRVEPIEKKIIYWLADSDAKIDVRGTMPEDPEWIAAPTAQDMYDILEFAHLLSMQVIMYGAAGMGKTVTCRHYQENHSNVWLLTPTSITSSKKGVLSLLCKQLGIVVGKSLDQLQEDCIEKMKDCGSGLIIIDEAQQLPYSSMDLMRQVAESAGVGLAYSGNEGVWAQMLSGKMAHKFAQINSRIMRRKHLRLPEYEDVESIAMDMGIENSAVIHFLYDISKSPGALRYVVKTIQLATMAADDEPITIGLVQDAFEELTGIRLRGAA